jgi:hypothetical protein
MISLNTIYYKEDETLKYYEFDNLIETHKAEIV